MVMVRLVIVAQQLDVVVQVRERQLMDLCIAFDLDPIDVTGLQTMMELERASIDVHQIVFVLAADVDAQMSRRNHVTCVFLLFAPLAFVKGVHDDRVLVVGAESDADVECGTVHRLQVDPNAALFAEQHLAVQIDFPTIRESVFDFGEEGDWSVIDGQHSLLEQNFLREFPRKGPNRT